jgi:FdhD protein
MPSASVETRNLLKIRPGSASRADDWVVVEEPLEVRVNGAPLAFIMRTRGKMSSTSASFPECRSTRKGFAGR